MVAHDLNINYITPISVEMLPEMHSLKVEHSVSTVD